MHRYQLAALLIYIWTLKSFHRMRPATMATLSNHKTVVTGNPAGRLGTNSNGGGSDPLPKPHLGLAAHPSPKMARPPWVYPNGLNMLLSSHCSPQCVCAVNMNISKWQLFRKMKKSVGRKYLIYQPTIYWSYAWYFMVKCRPNNN